MAPPAGLGGWGRVLEQTGQPQHWRMEASRMEMLVGPLWTQGAVCVFRVLFLEDAEHKGQDRSRGGRKKPA